MKTLLLISLMIFSSLCWGQFKLSSKPGRVDFLLCQQNHNIILDKFIAQADSQIERQLDGIFYETKYYAPEYKLNAYTAHLSELLIKRIILGELKKQLNANSLHKFFVQEKNYNLPYLNAESIKLDLESQFKIRLDHVINTNHHKIAHGMLKDLRNGLIKDALKSLASKRFRKVGAGIFARLVTAQTGKVATSAVLKSVTVSLGSKLFISAAKGMAIDLLTFPLHGYRLPPETLWTDLLEKYPELIMVPEWMKKGGVDDHPWSTHCNAIQRRTGRMVEALKKALKSDESSFISQIQSIHSLQEPNFKKPEPTIYSPPLVAIDNTYVKKPVYIQPIFTPEWAKLK